MNRSKIEEYSKDSSLVLSCTRKARLGTMNLLWNKIKIKKIGGNVTLYGIIRLVTSKIWTEIDTCFVVKSNDKCIKFNVAAVYRWTKKKLVGRQTIWNNPSKSFEGESKVMLLGFDNDKFNDTTIYSLKNYDINLNITVM